MAVDRKEKHKKKREEKRKAIRREAETEARLSKAEEYAYLADRAFRNEDYAAALKWAQKCFKLGAGDPYLRSLASTSAFRSGDQETGYSFLRECFERGELLSKHNHFLLGQMATDHEDFVLAQAALEKLQIRPSPLKGSLPRDVQNQAKRYLEYCRGKLEQLSSSQPSRPQETGGPLPLKVSPSQKAATAAAPVPKTSQAASDQSRPAKPATADLPQAPPSMFRAPSPDSLPQLRVVFTADAKPLRDALQDNRRSDSVTLDLTLQAYRLSFRTSYDQLICLPTLHDVESLWYQQETARKVMKTFRGRAILADEVGLGKTIEGGLILKEYLLRGLVRSALVLAPSSLVHQWNEELQNKFGIPFASSLDPLFKEDPDRFWEQPFILASIQTAKSKRHFDAVTARTYDIVIVDEAHHLKNRTTLNWKLVNAIQKTFLLLLTATPVQNNLEELYNLVTLLKPGHLKTVKAFKEEFVTRGNPTDPRNREKLRGLLKEVMVRNTRSVTQLRLPPRFALTVRVAPSDSEAAFYEAVSYFVADQAARLTGRDSGGLSKMGLRSLLQAAGSSPAAALARLERIEAGAGRDGGKDVARHASDLIRMGKAIHAAAKTRKVLELIKASPDQKILFVNALATLEHLRGILQKEGVPHVVFQGSMTAAQKGEAMEAFRAGRRVLLATGSGGEGHNLQFCHVMINYDLPWNPMEIEQRIGRIHRIGQEHEVQVYNFCSSGSLEDHILDVLDRKINMFELVVGEMDMILGRLQDEEEFEDLVYEIWVKHTDEEERRKAFDVLAARLKRARQSYEKSKELDEKLFHEDFGV